MWSAHIYMLQLVAHFQEHLGALKMIGPWFGGKRHFPSHLPLLILLFNVHPPDRRMDELANLITADQRKCSRARPEGVTDCFMAKKDKASNAIKSGLADNNMHLLYLFVPRSQFSVDSYHTDLTSTNPRSK